MNTDIVVGMGEVGSALYSILSERRIVVPWDPAKLGEDPQVKAQTESSEIDWCHIAIPYSDSFVSTIVEYIHKYEPENTVIHSTVKIGTCREIEKQADYGTDLFFSPVRGRHPRLTRFLRDFPKWYATSIFGELDDRIRAYFAAAGIQTRRAPSYEALEWYKLLETFTYGYNLVMWQEIERQAKKIPGHKDVNLSELKSWLYEKKKVYDGDLGAVPIYDLVPGPIGGHCIVQNWDLLSEYIHPSLLEWLKTSNDMRKE